MYSENSEHQNDFNGEKILRPDCQLNRQSDWWTRRSSAGQADQQSDTESRAHAAKKRNQSNQMYLQSS